MTVRPTYPLATFTQNVNTVPRPQSKVANLCITKSTSFYKLWKSSINKSVQSNLGRGPRHGAVAHVCCKVPIGYNGAPQIRPQKYPFPWTDPQTPLPASSLDLSELWCQMACRSYPPFFHNALDRLTHARMHRPTGRPQESLTTIGPCATRATQPNNTYLTFWHLLSKNHIFLGLFGSPALFHTTSTAILSRCVTLRLNFRLKCYVSRQYLWTVR